MVPLDLSGKNAFVTGVADDVGFGWHIAKALKAAGARVYLASHPRVVGIVQRIVERPKYQDARRFPFGVEGEFRPDGVIGCDVEFDTADSIPEEKRAQKGYREDDVSILGAFDKYRSLSGSTSLDILIHSVAFSPEIQNSHLETSRGAYLTAQSISAYSLVALSRAALPLMKGQNASILGLSYLAAEKVVPGYGGGMASAKASLESDARTLSWFMGEHGVRVNIISAGPYASRAARSIGDVGQMIEMASQKSPLRRPIEADEVASATLFMCSPLASGITGEVLHVDSGFNVMSAM